MVNMSDFGYLTKGKHVRLNGFQAKAFGTWSLAGMQMKAVMTGVDVSGKIAHVRGDDPITPKQVGIWLIPDTDRSDTEHCEKCNEPHVGPFDPKLIVEFEGTPVRSHGIDTTGGST